MTKSQRRNLDKLLREACFARDGYKCLRCGKTETLAPSHIYPKGRYPRMRYILDNVKTLCYGCHIHFWHKEPIEAYYWLEHKVDKNRLVNLEKTARNRNLKKWNYEEIKKTLREVIEKYD